MAGVVEAVLPVSVNVADCPLLRLKGVFTGPEAPLMYNPLQV